MSGPLAGLKVLELARVLAGPWAGQLLADLGADVVKVERRGAGDDTRQWGPPFAAEPDGSRGSAGYFQSTNRGKRSVQANFDDPEDRAFVRELAARADILIENFKVGDLARHGLDHESLKAINPGLIYCSITGFGQTGPMARDAGYDFVVQGMAGVMDLTGDPAGPPTKTGYATADIYCGLYSVVGVLAALNRRDRSGEGAYVDMALLDSQVSVLGFQAVNYFLSGVAPSRMGNGHPTIVPYDVFPAADGRVILAVGNDGQFAKLCDVLGDPDLARDERFARNAGRVVNRLVLTGRLEALTSRFTAADLLEKLSAVQVPAGPINTVPQVFETPQVIARGMRIEPLREGGAPGLRSPIVIDGAPMFSSRPQPRLGEHDDEVRRDPAWTSAKP